MTQEEIDKVAQEYAEAMAKLFPELKEKRKYRNQISKAKNVIGLLYGANQKYLSMNLNELRDKAYQCAIAHGWHEEKHSDEHFLCLIMSELIEAVQADRKGKRAKPDKYKTKIENSLICKGLDKNISKETGYEVVYEEWIKDTVEDELADACIRILDLAGLRCIDIFDFTEEEIYDSSQSCNDETFTETIYAISTIPIRSAYDYGYSIDEQLNTMLLAIFGLARHLNIDILWHIEQKMSYNELRSYKHGNKKY